jgi:hypothetical protein
MKPHGDRKGKKQAITPPESASEHGIEKMLPGDTHHVRERVNAAKSPLHHY